MDMRSQHDNIYNLKRRQILFAFLLAYRCCAWRCLRQMCQQGTNWSPADLPCSPHLKDHSGGWWPWVSKEPIATILRSTACKPAFGRMRRSLASELQLECPSTWPSSRRLALIASSFVTPISLGYRDFLLSHQL